MKDKIKFAKTIFAWWFSRFSLFPWEKTKECRTGNKERAKTALHCKNAEFLSWNGLNFSPAKGIGIFYSIWWGGNILFCNELFMFRDRCRCTYVWRIVMSLHNPVNMLTHFTVKPGLRLMTIDFLAGEIRLSWNKLETNLISELILTRTSPWPRVLTKPSELHNVRVCVYLTDSWDCFVKLHCDTQRSSCALYTVGKVLISMHLMPFCTDVIQIQRTYYILPQLINTQTGLVSDAPATLSKLVKTTCTHTQWRARTHTFSIGFQQKEISPRGKRDWRRKHENEPNVQMFVHFVDTCPTAVVWSWLLHQVQLLSYNVPEMQINSP